MSRSCPAAKWFLHGVASPALRQGSRRSNFCLSLAALGPLCDCVTIICLLRALMRTIGNGRLAACRSSRPLPKGAIQAGFASAVRDDRGVRSRRGGILQPASLLRSPPSSTRYLRASRCERLALDARLSVADRHLHAGTDGLVICIISLRRQML